MSTTLYPTYARAELAFERGEGVWLEASDGRAYLDFAAGVAVNSLGHAHPHLVEALTSQAQKLWHVSNIYRIPGQERLAERLCAASFADKAFFTNSGTEAVELAIKTARRYHFVEGRPERNRLITFTGAFHGRTLAAIAAGGQEKYLEGFEPRTDGFDQVPFGDTDVLERAIGPQTAGILLEPVQGEGGIRAFSNEMMRHIRALCDTHGLLLVLDEVQCGIGRTGKLFAHEWSGVTPDVMAVAKGIGGGFPVGACLASDEAAKGMTVGTHGSTYGGNPLAMSVANAVLDVVLEPEFLDYVRRVGLVFKQKLAGLVDAYPSVFEGQRGEGLMLGLKCRVAPAELMAACRDQGLLTVGAGENVLRLLPPLIVTEAEIADAVHRLDAAASVVAAAIDIKDQGAAE